MTAEELERQEDRAGVADREHRATRPRQSGMLTFHVFGAIAQFERALIRERTTAWGWSRPRRQGAQGRGRPPAMRRSDVTAARAMMKEESLPVRDIAERMGVSVATLYRYAGKEARPTSARTTGTRLGSWLTGRSDRPARRWSWQFADACRCLPPRDPGRTEIIGRAARATISRSSTGRCTARYASWTRPKSVRRADRARLHPLQAEMDARGRRWWWSPAWS